MNYGLPNSIKPIDQVIIGLKAYHSGLGIQLPDNLVLKIYIEIITWMILYHYSVNKV